MSVDKQFKGVVQMYRRPTVSRLGSYVNPRGIQQAPPRNLNDRLFGCAEFKTNFFGCARNLRQPLAFP